MDPDDDDGITNNEDIDDIFENPPSLEDLINKEVKHPDYAEQADIDNIFKQDSPIYDDYLGGDTYGGFVSLTAEEIDNIFKV